LKKRNYPIFYARLLLIFFAAGQSALYFHQHKFTFAKAPVHGQTLTEKCRLCDAMHHQTMALAAVATDMPGISGHYDYTIVTYTFVSLSLILSTGRAPPLLS
jgi:hypothetical protein